MPKVLSGSQQIGNSNDMDFVKEIAHKVTVVHQGKLLSEDSMEQVQINPKEAFCHLGWTDGA